MRRLFALVSILALVLTACKIESNFGLVINSDGSGTIIVEAGMDDEAQGWFLDEGDNPLDDQDLPDLPWKPVRQEQRDDMTFWIVEADVEDLAAIQDLLVGAQEDLLSSLSITVTADRVSVSATASAEDVFDGAEGFDPQLFEDSMSANIRITMPGRILDHNADSQRGNELTWEIPVFGAGPEIRAESDPSGAPAGGDAGGGGTTLPILIGAAALLVAAVLYFVLRRGKGATPAAVTPEGATVPEPPPTDE